MTWSLLCWSAVTLGTGWASSFETLLFLRVLLAIFQSFGIPAGAALIASYYPPSRRAFALALYFSGSMAGTLLCSLGGWVSEYAQWRTGFQVAGIAGIGCAGFLFPLLREPAHPAEHDEVISSDPATASRRNPVFSPRFLLLFAANGCVGFGAWLLGSWLSYYFYAERNLDLTSSAVHGVLTINFATLFGLFFFSRWSDRLSRHSVHDRAFVPAVALLVSAPLLFSLGWNVSFPLLFCILLLVGFAEGAVDPNLMPLLCAVSRPKDRAFGYGLLNFAATFCGGTAIYLGGWLKSRDIPLARSFQLVAAAFLLAGLFYCLYGLRRRPEGACHSSRGFT